MAKQTIDLGTLGGADGTGDSIRTAGAKINSNFTEIYAFPLASSQIGINQNEISTLQSNADIVLKPSGTGSIVFPAITIDDNTIKTTRSNDDLRISANGSGSVVIKGLKFSGTTIKSDDSTTVNINETLNVDGNIIAPQTLDVTGATTIGTLDVTGASTLSSLTVSGNSSFVGNVSVDNLQFNDNIISTSSNADLVLSPGGTGVVNVSDLTIDSSINLTDNVLKVINSNSDFVLSGSGTGSVQITKSGFYGGTIDNTVIGADGLASYQTANFTTITADEFKTLAVFFSTNNITTYLTNVPLNLNSLGTGRVVINGLSYPSSDGFGGQLIQTNGSGTLSFANPPPFIVNNTDIQDGTVTLSGSSSAAQQIDSWATATYRSVKYHIQISDTTADRYSIMDANVVHDGTNAFVSTFGIIGNGSGDGSTVYDGLNLSADVSGGNVRLLGTVNNTNNQVIKFVRRVMNI